MAKANASKVDSVLDGIDLTKLSTKDLEALLVKIEKQSQKQRVNHAKRVYKLFQKLCKELGDDITPEQVVMSVRQPAKKAATTRVVKPKYQSKVSDGIWSGRGHRPLWLEKEMESNPGLRLEDFLIDDKKAAKAS